MSIYQKLAEIGSKFVGKDILFKYGFNFSPMYRRSTGRIMHVSQDLMDIKMKLPISYKNRNYVNTIFGGSMFAAVDPIPMVQLMELLGKEYVVWDKSAEIHFKRPANKNLYAHFSYTAEELKALKQDIGLTYETEIIKRTALTDKDGAIVYCEVLKTIYVADKSYFKMKRAKTKK